MKTLGIHTKYFRFESKEKATESAQSIPSHQHKVNIDRECLVVFISVEDEDATSPASVATQLVVDTLKRAEQLNVKTMTVMIP